MVMMAMIIGDVDDIGNDYVDDDDGVGCKHYDVGDLRDDHVNGNGVDDGGADKDVHDFWEWRCLR